MALFCPFYSCNFQSRLVMLLCIFTFIIHLFPSLHYCHDQLNLITHLFLFSLSARTVRGPELLSKWLGESEKAIQVRTTTRRLSYTLPLSISLCICVNHTHVSIYTHRHRKHVHINTLTLTLTLKLTHTHTYTHTNILLLICRLCSSVQEQQRHL